MKAQISEPGFAFLKEEHPDRRHRNQSATNMSETPESRRKRCQLLLWLLLCRRAPGAGSVCPNVLVLPAHQAANSFQGSLESQIAHLNVACSSAPRWRSFAVHETVSSRDICLQGPSPQADPAVVCSFIHRRQKQMYKLCRQKINEASKGGFTASGLKAESCSALLQPVNHVHLSNQPCSLLKIKSGHMQNWCYSNTTIIAARCKLRVAKNNVAWGVPSVLRRGWEIMFWRGGRRAGEGLVVWALPPGAGCSVQSFTQTQSLLGYRKTCPRS